MKIMLKVKKNEEKHLYIYTWNKERYEECYRSNKPFPYDEQENQNQEGIELTKALHLLRNSDPHFMEEWERELVYVRNETFRKRFYQLKQDAYNPRKMFPYFLKEIDHLLRKAQDEQNSILIVETMMKAKLVLQNKTPYLLEKGTEGDILTPKLATIYKKLKKQEKLNESEQTALKEYVEMEREQLNNKQDKVPFRKIKEMELVMRIDEIFQLAINE